MSNLDSDLDYLIQKISEIHPNQYAFNPPEVWEREVEAAQTVLEDLPGEHGKMVTGF